MRARRCVAGRRAGTRAARRRLQRRRRRPCCCWRAPTRHRSASPSALRRTQRPRGALLTAPALFACFVGSAARLSSCCPAPARSPTPAPFGSLPLLCLRPCGSDSQRAVWLSLEHTGHCAGTAGAPCRPCTLSSQRDGDAPCAVGSSACAAGGLALARRGLRVAADARQRLKVVFGGPARGHRTPAAREQPIEDRSGTVQQH